MQTTLARWWTQVTRASVTNPVAFFFIFRWLTWVLAVAIIYTRSAPDPNLGFQPGVLMYTAAHLLLGTLYATSRRKPDLVDEQAGASRALPYDLVAVGFADMAGSLTVVHFTGGWGSPFWHFAVTSLLVPCFLLPFLWAMGTLGVFVSSYVLAIAISPRGLEPALEVGQQNIFIGQIVTAALVAVAVSYLGALFQTIRRQRTETRLALRETEALFGLAENVVESGTDLDSLFRRFAHLVRSTNLFRTYGVLLTSSHNDLTLAASNVGLEALPLSVAKEALLTRSNVTTRGDDGGWQGAIPLEVAGEMRGVIVACVVDEQGGTMRAQEMLEAMANLVALGMHNASLAREKADIAAQEERGRIAREIHDGIAQSIYMISLQLETCAELATRDPTAVGERLLHLVDLSRQTLLEVRHYIFDLKPYLEGQKGIVSMIENQAREFGVVAGITASVVRNGEERAVSTTTATTLYRVTQEALANTLKHAKASDVRVELAFVAGAVRLVISDNGIGFDATAVNPGHGLGNLHRRAEEAGGSLAATSGPGEGTRIVAELPV